MISWHTPDKTPRENKSPPLEIEEAPPSQPEASKTSALHFILTPSESRIKDVLDGLASTQIFAITPPYQIIFMDLPMWNDPEVKYTSRKTTPYICPSDKIDLAVINSLPLSILHANVPIRVSQLRDQTDYFAWLKDILLRIKPLLAANGVLIVKSLDRCRHYLKALIDDILGYDKFLNEVIIASPFYTESISNRDANLSPEHQSPEHQSTKDGEPSLKEVTGSLFIYAVNQPPTIIPQYKNKKSGGYWHSLHSEGQGNAKQFSVSENGEPKEITLTPPIGTHWKYKQAEIYRMCQEGSIKLTKNTLPVYWVKEKMGFIVDNNWFDLPSHYSDILGFLVDPQLMTRVVSTFSKPGDKILHLFHGMEKSGVSTTRHDRHYIGVDLYPPLRDALTWRCNSENLAVRFYCTTSLPGQPPIEGSNNSKFHLKDFPRRSQSPPTAVSHPSPSTLVKFSLDLRPRSLGGWAIHSIEHYNTANPSATVAEKIRPTPIPGNRLYWGDNLYAVTHILETHSAAFQLIYIDPPFFTGTDEVINIPMSTTIAPVKDIAYKNKLDPNTPADSIKVFAQWLYERVVVMRELLKETGFLALRFDYHFGHYGKLVLDSIFGRQNFLGELLVRRMTKNISDKALYTQTKFIVQHDSIFLYRKSPQAQFCNPILKAKRQKGDEIETECPEDNIWMDIDGYEKKKRTLYPTENSKTLLERIITLCTKPGDMVGDFFAGSGTTLYTAASMNRMWMGADIGYYAINEMRKLLLTDSKLQKVWQHKAFQVLNLAEINESKGMKADMKAHIKVYNQSKPQTDPVLQVTYTPSPDRILTLQLEELICSPSVHRDFPLIQLASSLDLLDFLAIDWDYHADSGFHATDFTMRIIYTKGTKALRTNVQRVFTHQYPKLGQYVIGLVFVDILGRKSFQFAKITL